MALTVFKSMGQQLREEVEKSLSYPITMLGVAHPVFFGKKDRDSLRDAVLEAGFNPSRSFQLTSGHFATAAGYRVRLCRCPMLRDLCSELSPRGKEMVLYVDYTEFAITIVLYEVTKPEEWNNGGVFYVQTVPKDAAHYGVHGNVNVEEKPTVLPTASSDFWNKTMEILRDMASETLQNRVDYLLLTGTQAADHELHEALKKSLGARFNRFPLPRDAPSTQNWLFTPQNADPLLVTAQGAADLSWRAEMGRDCLDPCSTWKHHVPQCLPMTSGFRAGAGSPHLSLDYGAATNTDVDEVDLRDGNENGISSASNAPDYLPSSAWQLFMGGELAMEGIQHPDRTRVG
ncbi:hypothetical protein LTR84_012004 [Exophiala bonariae]|uniref:Uncharacterized protein n=1 Tax=Exophiala bonariae TaxID=1690606 RepID=A0AAV9MRF8_9EURO|nr:hypothetical protein LTR84_012004 [Exophiala bonariae]